MSANQIELLTGLGASGPTRVRTVGHAAQLIAGKRARLDGRRIGVLHPEPGAADALAQMLRQRGAQVAVLSLDPRQLARLEALDPEVVIVEPRHFTGVCWDALRAVFEHPQLRWTCVLVSTPELVEVDGLEEHDMAELSAQVQLLCADYDAAVARVRSATQFDVALDVLGPARVLRLLVQSGKSWRVQIATPTLTMEVDIAEDLIVGARGVYGTSTEHTLLGTDALNVLLREVDGSVLAHAVERPAVTNIMCPLDTALATALHGRVAKSDALPRPGLGTRPIAKPSLAAKPSLPSANAHSSGTLSLVSQTLLGLPAMAARSLTPAARSPSPTGRSLSPVARALPPAPAAALSVVARSQASGAHSMPMPPQPDNDNGAARPFEPKSLLSTVVTDTKTPSAPVSASAAPAARPSASDEETIELRTKSLRKPLVAVATALAVTFGLLALSERPSVPSTAAPAKTTAAAPARAAAVLAPATVMPSPSTLAAPTNAPSLAPSPTPAAVAEALPAPAAQPADAPAEPDSAKSVPPASASAEAAEEPAIAAPVAALEEPSTPALAARELRALVRRANAFARQGKRLLREHKLDKAQTAYERALQAVPSDPTALGGQVQVALERRDGARAVDAAKAFVDQHPTSATAQLLLGDAYRLAADSPAARSAWKRAFQLGQPLARARLRSLRTKPEREP